MAESDRKQGSNSTSSSLNREPRILFFDIETAPSLGYFWEMFETNIIGVERHGYMLSFSAKWLDQKDVVSYALSDFKGYNPSKPNDKKLVQKLSELLDLADIVVAHNGDRFDITTTNTRLIANGFGPPEPFKTIDTLKIARSRFRFPSNKLDELGQYLGVGRKLPTTGKHLWFGCMKGDKDAWKNMKAYNAQDVILLEKVYLKLRPWAKNHPNLNTWTRDDGCPYCGSDRLQSRGYEPTQAGLVQRFKCNNCLHWPQALIGRLPKISLK